MSESYPPVIDYILEKIIYNNILDFFEKGHSYNTIHFQKNVSTAFTLLDFVITLLKNNKNIFISLIF